MLCEAESFDAVQFNDTHEEGPSHMPESEQAYEKRKKKRRLRWCYLSVTRCSLRGLLIRACVFAAVSVRLAQVYFSTLLCTMKKNPSGSFHCFFYYYY